MNHTFLNAMDRRRFKRQIELSEVGEKGQEKLKAAKVLTVGAGGLGCPVIQYLSAAGVGTIGIIDPDLVDISNLHRQVLYTDQDTGNSKVKVLSQLWQSEKRYSDLISFQEKLSLENASQIIAQFDLIVDATDNFYSRYLINDVCINLNKTVVSASVHQFEGQVTVFNWKNGACFRCLFPEPPPAQYAPSCSDAGVLGVVPGVMGVLQANEVLKLLIEIGSPLSNRLLQFNAMNGTIEELHFEKDMNCKSCSPIHGPISLDRWEEEYNKLLGTSCSNTTENDVSIEELFELTRSHPSLLLVDVREPDEFQLGTIGEAVNLSQGLFLDESFRHQFYQQFSAKQVVFFCQRGSRSAKVTHLMKTHCKTSMNLKGGYEAWQSIYGKTEGSNPRRSI